MSESLSPRLPAGWDDRLAARARRVPAIRWRRLAMYAIALLGAAYVASMATRIYVRKYYVFLPNYIRWALTPAPVHAGPTHVFFLFTDHFEPDYDAVRTAHWADRYAAVAARHRDSVGRPPQHTWFYPGEQTDPAIMRVLQQLTAAGLGEVELHYHHDYDTEDSLRPDLERAIAAFQQYGFLKTVTGRTQFAFIHGNFGLDNANGPLMCGVNTEIRLLHELGCFADFSFPSVYLDSQPSCVNTIYAARDDPGPASYRTPLPLQDLVSSRADLMMFEGPLIFAPSLNVRRLFLDLDDGDVHGAMPASPARVDRWVRANVHVKERPDWIFVKVFAHGASSQSDEDETVGQHFDETLSYLEHRYNDGQRYVLHYVTAREAYNLAIAAARGQTGDPERYLDSPVAPYVAGRSQPTTRGGAE